MNRYDRITCQRLSIYRRNILAAKLHQQVFFIGFGMKGNRKKNNLFLTFVPQGSFGFVDAVQIIERERERERERESLSLSLTLSKP